MINNYAKVITWAKEMKVFMEKDLDSVLRNIMSVESAPQEDVLMYTTVGNIKVFWIVFFFQ